MIRFKCPCGRQLQAAESQIGQPARCPLCDRMLYVPSADDPALPSAPRQGADRHGESERDHPDDRYGDVGRDEHGDFQRERQPLRYDEDGPPRRRYDRDEDHDNYRMRQSAYVTPTTCNDANTALWLGVVGLLCCSLVSPFALIYGIKALNQISRSDGALTGQGQAIAGIVLGAIGSLVLLAFVASKALEL